jgi:hypothetical protein
VGQAYLPLSTTVTSANYKAGTGQVLSKIGTVIGLENGPLTDQFFLAFNQLGSQSFTTPPTTFTAAPPVPLAAVADVGVRTFAQVNSTLSQLSAVPKTNAAVNATYLSVQQQLPNIVTVEGFSSANQVGVAQLAVQYCNTMVTTPAYQQVVLPGITLNASTFAPGGQGINQVSNALAARIVGSGNLHSMPPAATIAGELSTNLIPALCSTSACNTTSRVMAVTAAACAAAFGNAVMMIN